MLLAQLTQISDYKLTDLLSTAGATVGVIIAGTIFLQFLSAKFMELSGRYRELTHEYRGGNAGETRHGLLQAQIRVYRRRLRLMNWASCLAAVALLAFLLAVLASGFSLVYPPVVTLKVIGSGGLFLGLVLITVAVFLELIESVLARREIGEEVGDLDDPVKREPF